jgi:putative copper export protein
VIGNALTAVGVVAVAIWIGGLLWAAWCSFAIRRSDKAKEKADRVVAMRRMQIHLVGDDLVADEPPPRPFDHEVD